MNMNRTLIDPKSADAENPFGAVSGVIQDHSDCATAMGVSAFDGVLIIEPREWED